MGVKAKISVVPTDPENPETFVIMEAAILKLSQIGRQLEECPLNRRAILILLRDVTNLKMTQIAAVLDALPELQNLYLKKRT